VAYQNYEGAGPDYDQTDEVGNRIYQTNPSAGQPWNMYSPVPSGEGAEFFKPDVAPATPENWRGGSGIAYWTNPDTGKQEGVWHHGGGYFGGTPTVFGYTKAGWNAVRGEFPQAKIATAEDFKALMTPDKGGFMGRITDIADRFIPDDLGGAALMFASIFAGPVMGAMNAGATAAAIEAGTVGVAGAAMEASALSGTMAGGLAAEMASTPFSFSDAIAKAFDPKRVAFGAAKEFLGTGTVTPTGLISRAAGGVAGDAAGGGVPGAIAGLAAGGLTRAALSSTPGTPASIAATNAGIVAPPGTSRAVQTFGAPAISFAGYDPQFDRKAA